jgi:uncharacterized protein
MTRIFPRTSGLRALGLLAVVSLATAHAGAAEIRDRAGLFSPAAIREAEVTLEMVERELGTPSLIETAPSLQGESITDSALRHARSWGRKGVYVLIAKKEHKIDVRDYQSFLGSKRNLAIRDAFVEGLKRGDYDAALLGGTNQIAREVKSVGGFAAAANGVAPAPGRRGLPAPQRAPERSSGMSILLLLGVGIIAMIVLSRLFASRRAHQHPGVPGYGPGAGAPGYGMGGGGFWSGLFGGLGGAMAGNWLYDQMTGRHHHHDPSPGHDPGHATAGDDWGGAGDAGADWGGAGDAGGDWGGGDGGSW